ncbi:lipocalin family protein [Yeosuana sp. AK3]
MKKIIFVLLVFLIVACSSGNDDNSTSVIGTWKPISEVDVCSTGRIETYAFDTCEQNGRLNFLNNGTLSISFYEDFNGCNKYLEQTGTWDLVGDNLTLSISGESNNPTFIKIIENKLQIGYYDSDPNDPCDGGNLPSHYYTEFVRVE